MIVASEIVHAMKGRKGKKGWFAFKIDLEKAYDKLEWDFIRNCMINMGFDEDSVKLVMNCLSTSSSSIIINGKPSPNFLPSRGIRQGDPLSPYIFTLCMEWLSKLIHQECEEGFWTPFTLGRGALSISHLFFADDLILFGEANKGTLESMINTLDLFGNVSGQTKTLKKVSLFFLRILILPSSPLLRISLTASPLQICARTLASPFFTKNQIKPVGLYS